MGKFVTGEDYKEDGADQKTFGIHNRTPGEEWGNQIEVHGNEELRDRILRLLIEDEDRLNEIWRRPNRQAVGDPQ